MGWGSKLAHIGEIAGGVALEIGTAGAATPYAVPLIASGGSGLVQDFAGDKAQKQQQQATDAASKIDNQALAQQTALLSPYAAQGNASLQNLGMLMGGAQPSLPPGSTVPPTPTITQGPDQRGLAQTGAYVGQATARDPNAFVRLADGSVVPAGSLAALNHSTVRAN